MAAQIRLDLTRQPFAEGQPFGDVGPYELLQGRYTLAVEPGGQGHPTIVDLDLAQRNGDGLVECRGDLAILRPADLARGNRALFYDVVNRGNKYALPFFNDAPMRNHLGSHANDGGNGFLMRRGYSVVWSAWQGDILPVESRLTLDLPIAGDGDAPITGPVRSELIVEETGITSLPLSGNEYTASYPAASLDTGRATLTRRRREEDAREPIESSQWRFGFLGPNGEVFESAEHIHYPAGFEPGWLYELVYDGRAPMVMGLGILSIRELVSMLLTADVDAAGRPNPLRDGETGVERAYAWGISQCGRLLREFVYGGWNALDSTASVPEGGGRPRVFDGIITHVAGAGRAALNYRFAQPGRYPRRHEDHLYPSDAFPFTYGPTVDPASGREDAICKRPESDPKILHTQTSSEYWNRGGSLAHTDPTTGADLELPSNVRAYLFSSLEHAAGRTGEMIPSRQRHAINPVSAAPLDRAMLDALDAWVREDTEPPDSRVPRRDDGSAIDPQAGPSSFPAIPGVDPPDRANGVSPIERGEEWALGRIASEPPEEDRSQAYPLHLPAVDADGNDVPGVRLPEIAAPRGTYTGWNVWGVDDADSRDGALAGPFLHNVDGSEFPFPATRMEREASGDPRLSIEERYPTCQAYVEAVRASVEELVSQRLILAEDGRRYLARASVEALPGVQAGAPASGG